MRARRRDLVSSSTYPVDETRTRNQIRDSEPRRALEPVTGVDANPFAVAIARFRLLVAALRIPDVMRLSDAPAVEIHVVTGDS